jgi:MraZ protein
VFKGTFDYKIDAKGRLPVPAPFRRQLEERRHPAVVVTLLDQCLAVYAPPEWAKLESQLLDLPPFEAKTRGLMRRMASQAAECVLDQQGRILIPPALRKTAGLQRDVTIVGVLERFEVWRPEAWGAFLQESERLLDDVSQRSSTAKP